LTEFTFQVAILTPPTVPGVRVPTWRSSHPDRDHELVSLISAEHPALWRLAFGIAGAIGAAEVVLSLLRASREPRRERRGQQLLAFTFPFYIAIVAIAIHPTLAANIGIHLKPLETEAVVVSVLLFLGINYAWLLFIEPPHAAEELAAAERGRDDRR
jgi:hypothetical protein